MCIGSTGNSSKSVFNNTEIYVSFIQKKVGKNVTIGTNIAIMQNKIQARVNNSCKVSSFF